MNRLPGLCFATLLFTIQVTPAYAYGPKGHRIVAEIASHHLTDQAKAGIARIMGEADFSPHMLARVATWPDEIRSDKDWNPDEGSSDVWNNRINNTKWHYGTVPDPDADLSYLATPPENLNDGCIIPMLTQCQAVLSGEMEGDKLVSLKFLVHLVGDLHQPLHVGNGRDRGGNQVKVSWFGSRTNLHAVWDSKLIENENLSFTEYAAFLLELIDQEHTSGPINFIAWAKESAEHRVEIYDHLDLDTRETDPKLSYDYAYTSKALVDQRLSQAGVRLADVLNEIFK